ncbi:hypothetical protein ACFL6R_06660 [Gemmatimonadota bacterium]
MKKVSRIALAAMLVFPLILSGCTTDPENTDIVIVGTFSWPTFFIYEGGAVDFSNWDEPIIGGEAVDDATVTVTNTTTGESLDLIYYAADEYHPVAFYAPGDEDFPHAAGESVSVQISAMGTTFTGGPTTTSDSYATVTAPENATDVAQPFDLTWTIAQESGAQAATHVLVEIRNYNTDPMTVEAHILPISTTTMEISGYEAADNYSFYIYPVNRMEITGGGSTHYAYVFTSSYRPNYTIVNITGEEN